MLTTNTIFSHFVLDIGLQIAQPHEDFKCDHDPTHRVCAQLLNGEGHPLGWGAPWPKMNSSNVKSLIWRDFRYPVCLASLMTHGHNSC